MPHCRKTGGVGDRRSRRQEEEGKGGRGGGWKEGETKAENEATAVPDISTSNVLLTSNMNFNHGLIC